MGLPPQGARLDFENEYKECNRRSSQGFVEVNNPLMDLLLMLTISRRREGWKKSHGHNSSDPSILDSISNPPRTASVELAPTDFPVIKKYPCKFDAVARIIDFYPHQLADCLVLQCEKCRKQYDGFNSLFYFCV